MTLPFDICRCVAPKCKVSPKCARWVDTKNPTKALDNHPVPHADFSSQGLPCPHFIVKPPEAEHEIKPFLSEESQ